MVISNGRAGLQYRRQIFICLAWILGLTYGMFISVNSSALVLSCIRCVPNERLTLCGMILTRISPVVISALLIRISYSLLYLFAYFKAFCYGFCMFGLLIAFGTSGWLISIFLLFSEFFAISVLFWFWIADSYETSDKFRKNLIISIIVITMVGLIEYYFVSPYTAMLIIH